MGDRASVMLTREGEEVVRNDLKLLTINRGICLKVERDSKRG